MGRVTNPLSLVFDFDDEVDFDGDVEGEGGGAEGGAGVFAALAEDFEEEFGGSVDDLRVAVEVGLGVDEAVEGDDLLDFIERSDFVFDDGEAVEDDDAGSFLAFFDGDVGGDFTKDFAVAIDGEATGEEEQVTAADAVDVGGDGCGDFGKGVSEGLEVFECLVHGVGNFKS
jgi:hypothetical protein